eukprot:6492389-Amphidinium_carterae.1
MDASSISARAARQQARTEKTIQLAADKKVRELIKEYPWLSAHFVAYGEKLVKGGMSQQMVGGSPTPLSSNASSSGSPALPSLADGLAEHETSSQAGAVTPPSGQRSVAAPARLHASSDPGAALRGKVCHRQYGDLHGCPVIELKGLLNYLEPTMLHPFALRGASSVARNHNPSKTDLCKIIEFLTGMVPDSPVSDTIFPTFLHLGEHMHKLNCLRGRPCQLLRFPLTDEAWVANGVYRFEVTDAKIVLRSVIQNRQVEKEVTELGLQLATGDITINQNWSELKATLTAPGLLQPIPLITFFPLVEFSAAVLPPAPPMRLENGEAAPQRRRLAIQDGAARAAMRDEVPPAEVSGDAVEAPEVAANMSRETPAEGAAAVAAVEEAFAPPPPED